MTINLKHIEINIGKACNNKCIFCMSAKPELWDIRFVSFEVIKLKLEKYYNNGYRSVGFLGGDISIHPNIIEIISFAKNIGYININIISNGMKFDDENFSKNILSNGVTRVNLSIHSHIEKIEDMITQVPGGLKRKIKAIDNFKKFYNQGILRDDLSINIVLNYYNYSTIIESCLFFYKHKGISDIRINFIWLSKDIKENRNRLKISYTQILPYIKKLIYLSIKYNIRITFDTIPICILYKIDKKNYKILAKKFIGEDIDHIIEIDHINDGDNFDWKKRKKNQFKIQTEKCNSCSYLNSCQGVRKTYVKCFGDNELLPIYDEEILIEKNVSDDDNLNLTRNVKENISIEYFYKEISKGNVNIILNQIEKKYNENSNDERYSNLYSVALNSLGKYNDSIEILLKLIKYNKYIKQLDNIYYNIAVNYVGLNDFNKAEDYLVLAKNNGLNDKNFIEYYDNFFKNIKKSTLDDYKNEIEKMLDDEGLSQDYFNLSNIIDKLK